MSEFAHDGGDASHPPEVVRLLMANTGQGVMSRIWYDRDDGQGISERTIEPKLLVHGTDGLLVFAYQVEPSRGVRHFAVGRITRVEPNKLPLLSQMNTFCSGEVLVIRAEGGGEAAQPAAAGESYSAYLAAVREVVSDLRVEPLEIERVEGIRQRARLTEDQVRAAHACVYAEYLLAYGQDGELDATEADHLRQLANGLETLGWRPA